MPEAKLTAHATMMAIVPSEHKGTFEPLAAAPEQWQAAFSDLVTRLRALGIPWAKIAALVPLFLAVVANPTDPSTLGTFILAIINLFIGTP